MRFVAAAALLFGVSFSACSERTARQADSSPPIADLQLESGCIMPPEAGPDLPLDAMPRIDLAPAPDTGVTDTGVTDTGVTDTGVTDAALADGATRDGVADQMSPDLAPGLDGALSCPVEMSQIVTATGSYCVDRYEASRPDATANHQGTATGAAQCRAGVRPWWTSSLGYTEAKTACELAGKRLCTTAEWQIACAGPAQTKYAYGADYSATICNGIDRFCLCGAGSACEGVSPCPYPHCYNHPPPADPTASACGAYPHDVATGTHAGCLNAWGLYDMNGNVWELADGGDGLDHFRGGAYNCLDSEWLHQCTTDIVGSVWARGFRCCKDPS